VEIPTTAAQVVEIDFKAKKIKSQDWAVAALTVLARGQHGISVDMLKAGVGHRFRGVVQDQVLAVVDRMLAD
jgi:hypothetical protein